MRTVLSLRILHLLKASRKWNLKRKQQKSQPAALLSHSLARIEYSCECMKLECLLPKVIKLKWYGFHGIGLNVEKAWVQIRNQNKFPFQGIYDIISCALNMNDDDYFFWCGIFWADFTILDYHFSFTLLFESFQICTISSRRQVEIMVRVLPLHSGLEQCYAQTVC